MRVAKAPLLLIVLLATACGSTVEPTGVTTAPPAEGLSIPSAVVPGTSGSTTGALAPVGSATAGTAGSEPPIRSGMAGTASSPSGTGASPSASATQAAGESGAMVPATFKIGLQYSSSANAALSAIGALGLKGDAKAEGAAVLAWINKHGGIAGRPATPSWNNIGAAAAPATQSESACTQWTQDDHVSFAVPTSAVEDNNLLRVCLGHAGVPAFYGNIFNQTTDSSFRSSPLWVEPNGMSVDAYARTYVAGLAAQGFFKGGKVGVVYNDSGPYPEAMKTDLLPALRQAGVTSPRTFAASISGVSDLGGGAAQMSGATLRFRSAGVTKVLFFEPWVGYFSFLDVAQSQDWHPEYGLSSQEAPDIAQALGLLPAKQLVGSRIVSWFPMTDLKDSTRYAGPRTRLCKQIYKSAHVPIYNDTTDYVGEMAFCDNLLLVQDTYQGAPRRLTPSAFTTGLARLGTTAQMATHPYESFSATKHWGLEKYWAGHFVAGCACFEDGGAPQEIRD